MIAFAILTGAIFLDLAGRELLGQGIFIAQRLAVYCMVAASLFGESVAAET